MRRRALLAVVGVTASAGTAGRLSVGGGCTRGRSVTFEPVDSAAVVDRETHAFPNEATPPVLNALFDRALGDDPFAVEATAADPLG